MPTPAPDVAALDTGLHTPRRCRVQFPQALTTLDYRIPAQMSLAVGDLVIVPLGTKNRVAVVVALSEATDSPLPAAPNPEILYKTVQAKFEHLPPLSTQHLGYLDWLADYYLAPRGNAYRLAFPPKADFYAAIPPEITYTATSTAPDSLSVKQSTLYAEIIRQSGKATKAELLHHSQTSTVQLRALCDKGLIAPSNWKPSKPKQQLAPLSDAQNTALAQMLEDLGQNRAAVSLLDGETGSGKTEVYFHLIAIAIAQQKQVLILLPEVSLLVDWQQRFKVRFGFTPPCWHNGITPKSRRILWQQAATGALSVVVGARSALHLPFATLGLIVLDEEHDFSYKQDDGIPYHARDMAVVRAQHHRIPLVLVSATPSLESLENARRSKYRHVLLPIRYQAVALPDISLIDTRQHRPAAQDWLSPPLIAALHQTLTAQQQAVLFLNRRGFAPLLLCRNCGYRFHCPECDVNLTEHRYPQRHLNCHHCGFTVLVPKQCPNCQHPDHLSSAGPGVERIIDNLQQHLPNARTFVATADTLDTPAAVSAFLEAMQNRAIDIVVGTQIIAKGFDFPYLTLAGVIDADQALFGSNPRASEQTWQLLHQIAGRTGRHHLPGRALLQTQNPDDIVFQSLKKMDRNAFFAQQRRVRKAASMPPFGRLLALIIQSRNARLAETTAHTLAKHSPSGMHRLLGPLPAPISRLRGWYRQRLLLLAPRQIALQPIAQTMITRTKIPANVRLKVDVDPYNFV